MIEKYQECLPLIHEASDGMWEFVAGHLYEMDKALAEKSFEALKRLMEGTAIMQQIGDMIDELPKYNGRHKEP